MAKRAARKTRKSVIAGVIAGVLSLGVAGTALATNATHETATGRTSASTSTVHTSAGTAAQASSGRKTVENFYNAYIYALKKGKFEKAENLRQTHLTAHCEKVAKAWAQKHNADPVMRAKRLPRTKDHGAVGGVDYVGKGKVKIILNYKDPKTIPVSYDVKSKKITAIG